MATAFFFAILIWLIFKLPPPRRGRSHRYPGIHY